MNKQSVEKITERNMIKKFEHYLAAALVNNDALSAFEAADDLSVIMAHTEWEFHRKRCARAIDTLARHTF